MRWARWRWQPKNGEKPRSPTARNYLCRVNSDCFSQRKELGHDPEAVRRLYLYCGIRYLLAAARRCTRRADQAAEQDHGGKTETIAEAPGRIGPCQFRHHHAQCRGPDPAHKNGRMAGDQDAEV